MQRLNQPAAYRPRAPDGACLTVVLAAILAGSSASALAANGRARSLSSIGIENVNDSPLKASNYRTLLRFVPRTTMSVDRIYFGFKLRGANCWDGGNAGYGAGDGGLMLVRLVSIDKTTGLPAAEIDSETVNGCTRHDQAKAEANNQIPVLVWASLQATLKAGKMYGLVVSNVHADPAHHYFSFNAPIGDAALAGPHGRNELSRYAKGAVMSLDPREHVAWSEDSGRSWRYGKANGQYLSYINDHDTNHPAIRLPQYGFRLTNGSTVPGQPYYAYSVDCVGCTVAYGHAVAGRDLTQVGGYTAGNNGVGTLTLRNLTTGKQASCTPSQRYGFRQCTLPSAVRVEPGQTYTISATGSVELMKMDYSMRLLFPQVGHGSTDFPAYQPSPAPGTNQEDVPNLWAGPLSPHVPN